MRIRTLIGTTVVRIRILIGTTVVRIASALSIGIPVSPITPRTLQDTPGYPRTLQDTPRHLYFRILTLNNSTYDGKEISSFSGSSTILCVYYYCCIDAYQCCTGYSRTLYFCSNNLNAGLNTTQLSKLSVIINKSLNLIHCLSFINE